MDFIRYVNSKDVRQYLYDIDYKLSADQVIFVVLSCPFISVDEKVKSLEEYLQSSDALPLTSITDMSFQETFGINSHEFIRRYISDVRNMTAFMKADTRGYFYQVRIQHKGKLEPEPIECFKSYKACFDAIRNYSKEYSMDPEDRLRIDKLSFDDEEEGNGENYLSDSNYCLFSKNLDLMNIYVYDHPEASWSVSKRVISDSNLTAGNYILCVGTIPDGNHNPVIGSINITVNKIDSKLSLPSSLTLHL